MKLKVTLSGSNEKQPMVLLHGWGLNSAVWEPILAAIHNDYFVIRIDLPGYGKNKSVLPEVYTLENIAMMIADVIPDHSIVVGWSLGGLVAKQLALDLPHKVSTLCIVASSPCFAERESWGGIKRPVLRQFTELLAKDLGKTVERFLAIQAMGSEFGRQDVKRLKQLIMAHPLPAHTALMSGLHILESVDIRQQIGRLEMPVKGIFGRLDSLVPKHVSSSMSELIREFEFIELPKASHAPFISHTDAFTDALKHLVQS